jgi:hydroxypyruvate isomerase
MTMSPASWGSVDANISILFTELPMLERPAAAREAGFTAIEAWWPFGSVVPGDAETDGFERAVRDAGVRLVSLNGFAGDMAAGERGIASWPGRRPEFLDNLAAVMGLGDRLGCRRFNILYGNRVDGADAAAQDELAGQNLADAARAAQQIGASIVVEPLSGAPHYPLRTADDVIAVLDRLPDDAAPAAGLLADLYHLCVNGEDVAATLNRVYQRIGHVQVADAPGRHEPGTGTADLDAWVRQLRELGYDGCIGLEYAPLEDTVTGLRRMGLGGAAPSGPQPA